MEDVQKIKTKLRGVKQNQSDRKETQYVYQREKKKKGKKTKNYTKPAMMI